MAHTYPVLMYLVLVITSTTRNTIVSGAAQQFDANPLERCPTTDNDFTTVREDIRQQLIPLIEGGNIGVTIPATREPLATTQALTDMPPITQPPTEEVKPPPTTEAVTPPPTTQPTTEEDTTQAPTTYTCNGTPGWTRVVNIDITDTSTACPQGLNLTSYPRRTCGRANVQEGCSSTTFTVGGSQYSRVCGRIRGYQYSGTGAFFPYWYRFQSSIDSTYVDGVSLTHGAAGSRQHIWTFAAGLTDTESFAPNVCPCATTNGANIPPPFVGNDYFCESGIHREYDYQTDFFLTDVLWDGQDCTQRSTCCTLNSPPWFTKTLASSTTDDIELRICVLNPSSSGDVPLELIELYIQ